MRRATWWLCAVGALVVGCAHGAMGEQDEDDDGGFWVPSGGHSGTGGAVSASSSSQTTNGASVSSSAVTSTGSGGTCDAHGDCGTCANCSLSAECTTQANACLNDVSCTDFLDCLGLCQDDVCANACASQFPTGANLYMAMTACALCTACPSDCALEGQGFCTP